MIPVLRRLALAVLLTAPGLAQPQSAVFDGRLFTTAAERQRLDRLRRHADVTNARPRADRGALPSPAVHVQGIVLRSDGPYTAWVNDRSVRPGAPSEDGLRIDRDIAAALRILLQERGAVTPPPEWSHALPGGAVGGARTVTPP